MRRLQLERLRYARRQASIAEARHEESVQELRHEESSDDQEGGIPATEAKDSLVRLPSEPQQIETVPEGYHAITTELYASETEYRASVDGSLLIKIISINGLDGKHAWWGESLSAMSLDRSEFTFDTSLLLNEDSPAEIIRKAASELLGFIDDNIDMSHEYPAVVFLARDIGGTLLKSALLLAYESTLSSHKRLLENTTHLLFFATPHRASEQIPWDYTISNLIYQKAQGTSGIWLPRIVRELAMFHKHLAAQFESFGGQYHIRYINYYQRESTFGHHSIVIPRYAATFGHHGERQIGREESHGTLANLSQPDVTKEILSVLQDANATKGSEYREALSLLSRSDLEPLPPRKSKSTYLNLCKRMISAGSLIGMNDPETQNVMVSAQSSQHPEVSSDSGLGLTVDPETTHMRKSESVTRSIQIVDLDGCNVDTAALTSSLITTILQEPPQRQYHFITLVNHPPRRIPATKLQLLVGLAHQYLRLCPRIFRRVQPLFEDVRASLETNNTSWKEMRLERLVKSLLRYHGTDIPIIIIIQPCEENNAGPAHELASCLLSWVKQTEIYARIIAVQYRNSSLRRSNLGTAIDQLQGDSELQMAVQEDHKAEMEQAIQDNAHLSMLRDGLAQMLRGMRIMTPSQWIPIFENHLFTSVPLPTVRGDASQSDQNTTDLMLDSVAGSTNPWIKAGLGWITHAVRPLAYAEFQKVLSYEAGLVDHGDLSAIVSEEFRKLLSGLVETNGGVIYFARSEIVALLIERLLRQREQRALTAVSGSAQSNDWSHTTCHPDLYIARYCIKVLRENFNNEAFPGANIYDDTPESLDTAEDGASGRTATEKQGTGKITEPMLSYAADNWLAHAQLWINGSESSSKQSIGEEELKFIRNFIHDQNLRNWWLRHRGSLWGGNAGYEVEYEMPHIAEVLGLNSGTPQELLKLAKTVQFASDMKSTRETGEMKDALASILIASAQLGDFDTLARVDGRLLEELLPKIFRTGTDATLCYLASRHKEFVEQNWKTIMVDAIRMGNLEFFSSQGACGNSSFEPSLWLRIAEHGSYLPGDALDSLTSLSPDDARHIAHLAAASGHSALIGKLIEAGCDLSRESSPGITPLFLAAQHGHYTIASQLLAATTDVTMLGKAQQHSTPLHAASASGYPDLVRLLLKHGYGTAVGLSSQDDGGNTALHLALANDHIDVAIRLLEAHEKLLALTTVAELGSPGSATPPLCVPSLNAQNLNLQTPLISAVQSGSLKVVQSLLHNKVDVNLFDKRGKTALHYAAALETPDILVLLLEVPDIKLEARDGNEMTPLHEAALQGRPANIECLLKCNADHTAVDKKDRTSLELASEAGHSVSAKVLLPLYGRHRITASFLKAVSAGNTKMAELLMDAGADKNAVIPETSTTALHLGASRSDARLVQSLLLRKAELDPKDEYGRTPLYEAACRGAANCLKLLVDAGADVNVSDSSEVTALIAAATQNYERCVDILLAAPAQRSWQERYTLNIDGLLNKSVSVLSKVLKRVSVDGSEWDVSSFGLQQLLQRGIDAVEALDILFQHGLNHEKIISDHGTMLHHAVYWDEPELVSYLAKNGRARPGFVYAERGTPLQIAAWHAKPNALTIVKTLLQEGADAELGSEEIGSPLHAATRMHEGWSNSDIAERYMDIAQAIIDHKHSTINKIAGVYPTVLESAVRCGSADMVMLILDNSPDMSPVLGTYGTPLHIAVAKGYWRETAMILSYNSPYLNAGTPDQEGRLPLHLLSRNSHWDETDYNWLIDGETARISATDKQKRHMVHFCAGQGNDSLLLRVLEMEPRALEAVDVDGWTPLHWACRQKSTNTAQLLLNRNANKNALTYRGWRPIDVAKYHGFMQDPDLQSSLQFDSTSSLTDASVRCAEDISHDDEETVPVKDAPNRVEYFCDSCGCFIHGPRYRCDECYQFDMCFKCFRHVRLVHYSSHTFRKFNDCGEMVSIINPWQALGKQ